MNWVLGSSSTADPETLESTARMGALLITSLTLSTSLTHRGLFVPREEIERLFSAPLTRATWSATG